MSQDYYEIPLQEKFISLLSMYLMMQSSGMPFTMYYGTPTPEDKLPEGIVLLFLRDLMSQKFLDQMAGLIESLRPRRPNRDFTGLKLALPLGENVEFMFPWIRENEMVYSFSDGTPIFGVCVGIFAVADAESVRQLLKVIKNEGMPVPPYLEGV